MIDRLREQIQERLDQIASEVDRLRKALAALDPRTSTPPARKRPARGGPSPRLADREPPSASPVDKRAVCSRSNGRSPPGATGPPCSPRSPEARR